MSIMLQKDYQTGRIKGWLGEDTAKYQWNLLKNSKSFKRFQLRNVVGAASRRMMLFDITRKVLGKDTENYPQEIGDCVSFGMKNAIEHLMCCEILLNGENEVYTKVFPPYIYGISRVDIGGNQLGSEDGSLGSWAADGVVKYGIINSDAEGLPPYSGSVAKSWGSSNGSQYLNKWKPLGQKHLVKSAAKIDTWDKLLNAICNGYPCTIASNQGFTMTPDSTGFHQASGNWGHQMCGLPNSVVKSELTSYIEDVKIGDNVYGNDGALHKVTEVFQREVDEEIVVIKAKGALAIKVTKNHPVLIMKNDECKYTKEDEDITFDWINAEDVKKGDKVVCPLINLSNNIETPQWIKESKLNRLIEDDDIAWLFGLYVADGGADANHKMVITLGSHQIEEIDRACKSIEKLGLEPHVKYKGNYTRIITYSSVLANSMIKWFNKKTNKVLPEWLFNGKWNLKEVLKGIFDGDGNLVKDSKNCKRIVNTSVKLIDQIHSILLSFGEKPYVSERIHKSDYAKNWNKVYVIEWFENNENVTPKFNRWKNNYYSMNVDSVEFENYKGLVYNFEVEDVHSYILNGITVHNCVIGIDDEYSDPYVIILNSWGDVMGTLKDFNTGVKLPVGTLRVKKSVMENMMRTGECFSISNFQGFPGRQDDIEKALFKLI